MRNKIAIELRTAPLKRLAFAFAFAFAAMALLGAADGGPYRQGQWAELLAERMALTRGLPAGEAMALLGGRGADVHLAAHAAHLLITDSSRRTWRYDLVTSATAAPRPIMAMIPLSR